MANKFFPEKKGGRIIALLLLALGIAAVLWHYHGVPPWATRWFGHRAAHITVAVPQRLPSPAMQKPAVEQDAGKDCLKQQAALLAKAREETLAKVKAIAEGWRKTRPRDADALIAYVAANPNGDPGADGSKKPDVLEGKVGWNLKLPSGGTFHFDDTRHVCICHKWRYSLVFPAPQPAIRRTAALVRESGCSEIDFNAYGPYVRWGVGSVDGPLKPSACNAQRQGPDGMFAAWYGICSDCIESTSVLEKILGTAVQIWHKFFYDVSATEQTLRFGKDIKTKAVYICITYRDGTVHTVFVRPEDWRGTNRIRIDDAMWESPDGTDQKHLH